MSLAHRVLLRVVRAMVRASPDTALAVEQVAAMAQGKGYGASSIAQENEMILRLLGRKPELAIDIGGNIGEYAAELRRHNGELEIHIFEPSDVNVEKLNQRFANDDLISVIPSAVSNYSGSATLYSNAPGSALGSLTRRRLDHFNASFDVQQNVSVIRFEDYWRNNLRRRSLDIVKLDIEGHELAALDGFGSAIDSVRALQFEFGGCNIDTRTFFQDFWYFFQPKRFDIFRITPTGVQSVQEYREADEFFATTNYIVVNRKRS